MQSDSLLGHYAGFISRFLALLIDIIITSLTFAALTWFISVTTTVLRVSTFLGISFENYAWFRSITGLITSPVTTGVVTFLFLVSYHVFFWLLIGQTPGKALLGVRVVAKDGRKLSFVRALLRCLGYGLSALPLGAGFFWILIDDKRQGFHDKISGTYVIYTWAARPDEKFLAKELKELGH